MKEAENKMTVKFASLSRNEALARSLTTAFMIQLDPTIAELADMKCAVSEAVTNAVVHGYRDCIGTVFMSFWAYSDRSVKIEIRDRGVGIEDIAKAREPLFTTDPQGERSGMGFTVMESFCNTVRIISKPKKGTKVTLIKKLAPLK